MWIWTFSTKTILPAGGEEGSDTFPYTVKAGDTLTSIAKNYHTTVAKLAKINQIADVNKIYVGQVLRIPKEKETYPVWVGACTGNRVNVRKGPGLEYGNIEGYPRLNKENLVDVIGEKKAKDGCELVSCADREEIQRLCTSRLYPQGLNGSCCEETGMKRGAVMKVPAGSYTVKNWQVSMSYLWGGMILMGIIYGVCAGNSMEVTQAVIDSSKEAVSLCLGMAGITAFWSGLMKIAEEAGIVAWLTKRIRPLLRFLFPRLNEKGMAMKYIAVNMIANFLGMGMAATPAGLRGDGRVEKRGRREKENGDDGLGGGDCQQ